jgi:hypothetical protein
MTLAERTAVLESVTDAVLLSLPGPMPLTEKLTIASQCRRDLARQLGCVGNQSEPQLVADCHQSTITR